MREQRRSRVFRSRLAKSNCNIWCLPEEVQLLLLKGLPAKDLLSMRAAHPKFRNLIDSNPSIWSTVHFHGEWPSPGNRRHFERAVEHNNIEAIIKLGVAYLYNEGISEDGKATNNSSQTSKYFCKAESLSSAPFTWLFIRPPWSPSGTCCKAMVFNNMKNHCKAQASSSSTMYCIAKILSLFDDESKQKESLEWYQEATNQGSPYAGLVTWRNAQNQNILDPGCSLNSIRQLRECANNSCIDVKLTLFECYAKGQFGGLTAAQVAESICQIVKSSRPTGTHNMFLQQQNLNASMRYILIDWLVEVTGMKDFGNLTLHTAVRCIDRYLMLQPTTRSNLQLLGIAAMVICSRLMEKDIITIREAAWLTDGTYSYEEVVRMIGEIVAVLHGQIRVFTVVDYLKLFCNLAAVDRQTEFLGLFLAEMTLLYTEFGVYAPATIAASAVFLSRMLLLQDFPWSADMTKFTGYKVEDITPCTLLLFKKCFVEPSLTDHRDVTLMAVKQRYSERDCMEVAKMEVMKYTELCNLLGAQPKSVFDVNSSPEEDEPCQMDFLSPNKQRMDQSELSKDRDSMVVTPIVELSESGHDNSVLTGELGNVSFDSVGTGYEGDRESEGEMEVDEEGDWCMDTSNHLDEPKDISGRLASNTFSAIVAVDTLKSDHNSGDTSNSELSSPACFNVSARSNHQGPSPGSARSYRINAGGKLSPCKHSVLKPVQNVYSGRLRRHTKGLQHKNVTQRQRQTRDFGLENSLDMEHLA